MNSKLKLNPTGNPLTRLDDARPSLSLAPSSATRSTRLSYVERIRVGRLVARESVRVVSQRVADEAEAQMHVNRLLIQSRVVTAGEQIALEAATNRQALTADCTRATASGVCRLEDERFSRTKDCVLKQVATERELDSLVASGQLPADYGEFLKQESIERTQAKIERDKSLTRSVAEQFANFSALAISGFQVRSEGGER